MAKLIYSAATTTYVRGRNKIRWHRHKNCSKRKALKGKLIKSKRSTRPTNGEFCDECLAKEKADNSS